MPLRQLLQRSSGELQAELQLILNAVVEGLCGVDAQGNATFCNDALLRMTGYRSEELIGNNLHALLHHSRPDGTKYPEEECDLRKALDACQGIHAVELLWRKDGSSFSAEYWAHPLRQPSSLTASVITIQDISERERAIEALRASEERFRQISNNIDQAFYLVDVIAERMVYASPAFETITGHSCQEACEAPSPWRNLAVPEHRERVIADYLRLVAGQETRSEYQIRHGDGSTRWIKDHAKPICGANGEVSMFAGVAEDITEIHEARDTLQRSEEKFRRILTGVPDVAWTSDRDRRTTYVSPKVEMVLGYTKGEFCAAGGSLRSGLIHPEDFGRVNRGYRALFEKQSAFDQEYRIRRKDGTWIWIHDRATGTHEEDGVLYADGVFSDITERKQSEAELQTKTAFLEAQANSTIDGILVVAGNGRRLMQNQRYVEMFHVPPEIVANHENDARLLQHVASLIKDRESFVAKIKHLYRHPSETSRDEIELKDGRVLDRYSAPVVDEGRYYGRIWTFRDITERKRNEDMLRQLSTAVEQSPVSVVITDPCGKISYVNREFTECTGYEPEEVLGKNPRILNAGRCPAEVYRSLWSTITQGQEWRGELCNKKKNGDFYWEAATIRPITDAKGAITHYLAIKEDITERKRAEEELFGSRQMLQSVLDAIPQRVFWKDRDSVYLGCNRAFASDAGLDAPSAIIGKNDFDLAWAGTAEVYRADDKLVMDRGSAKLNFEERQSRPDGIILWLQTNKLPLRDREGKVTGVLGTYEDVTERKETEQTLQRSEEKFRQLAENIHEVFWMMSPTADEILYVSPAYEQVWGRTCESLYRNPMAWTEAIHPDDLERAHSLFARQMQGERIASEYRIRTLDGVEKWISDRAFPVRDKAGRIIRVVGIAEETTDRKRAEKELRLTQFSLDNSAPEVFWTDRHARIVYANETACRSLGRTREELLSLSITDIDPLFPKESWDAHWQDNKKRGSNTFETQHKTKEGRVYPVEVTSNYVEFDGQEYSFAFARDITERRALESQLRHAQKLEGIGQLAAGIAHEINTPTQFVADNLTFLRDSWKATHELLEEYRSAIRNAAGTIPEEIAAALNEAERNCDLDFIVEEVPRAIDQGLDGAHRVAKIVRAMKEFSHPDSAEKTATDLNKAIESTITVARSEWKYIAEVATELDETLPAVVCYPGDINQVILNLLVNAAHAIKDKVKDGDKGQITVGTRGRGEFVQISVTDTGSGIPEAIRTRIFDPFFTTKEVGKGTGQGLSLAHTVVVKKHSGKIWFETEMGVGTTFFIDLPIQAADQGKEN